MFNQEENRPLFGNNNMNINNNSGASESSSSDIPPELGEIKPLNNIESLSAPTKKVLDAPNSFFSQEIQAENKDKLDYYENNLVGMPNQTSYTTTPSIDATNDILQQQSMSDNETKNEDILSSYVISSDDILNNYDSFLQESETTNLVNSEDGIPGSVLEENNVSQEKEVNTSVIPKEQEYSVTDNTNKSEELSTNSNDYEILNNLSLSDEKEERLDPFGEEDTLSIEDPEEQKIEISDENNEYLVKIKEIVNQMNNDGIKTRIEEFDFESIHQIIVVIEK